MRLTQIKLSGFKSFVDPTTIPIPGQIIGIVGPNGCGKSNVIDAVRWVLGESKASALRGETMQDVIFNGSGGRQPVSRASVELVFDNSLGKAAGQWSQYAEIAIKRVIQRDGESSYYINNTHVRRRDITDIFMGTGLGPRAYAIIEQGMISRIIEAKPEELRIFLEEAAGVSKYKERRRETENRLTDSRENLSRVDDIRQELEQQLTRLEAQAKVATEYHELQASLKIAQQLLWLFRKNEAVAQREKFERDVQRLSNDLEAETARLRDAENRLETIRADHFAASDLVHTAQGELYEANAEVARLEQEIQHLRDSQHRLEQQINSLRQQETELEKRRVTVGEQSAHWQSELIRGKDKTTSAQQKVSDEIAKLPQAEENFRQCEQLVADLQHKLSQAEQSWQIEETHRSHAEKNLQQLGARRSRLLSEQQCLPKIETTEFETLGERQQEIAGQLHAQQIKLNDLQNRLPEIEQRNTELKQTVQSDNQKITQLEARRHALQQLQDKLESNESHKGWLEKYHLVNLPRLWQNLKVESGWEDAMEAILRERLNAILLEDLSTLNTWLQDPPPAKLALFTRISTVASSANLNGHRPLLDLIECKDAELKNLLSYWLNDIYCVDSTEQAFAIQQSLAPCQMLVNKAGNIFMRGGVIFYAPETELHGVLARSREIEELSTQLAGCNEHLGEKKIKLVSAETELNQYQKTSAELRNEIADLQQENHKLQIEHVKKSESMQRATQRREQIEVELAEIKASDETETIDQNDAVYNLAEYQKGIDAFKEQLDEVRQQRAQAQNNLTQQRSALQSAERVLQEAGFFEKTCGNKIEELKNSTRMLVEQQDLLKENLADLLREQAQINIEPAQQALQAALENRQVKEKALVSARDTLEEKTNSLKQTEQEKFVCEQKLHPLREKIQDTKLKEQEAKLNEAQFETQLSEAGADQMELSTKLEKSMRVSGLQGNIDKLNQQITALGAVNLAALEELQVTQERKGFLDSQATDLREAIETLENAIHRIDKETRVLLQETFDSVNRHFSELFPSLFGGGQAKLVLTGEEILDSGVQVIAQPPGKKNSSIHLLSGGEKALTALSLIFSMFQLNPAPFCLLDEVDAPLDDANTVRFCDLLKKMMIHTQFMFISHNKITMEIAEQLIGVTMQEFGVSRVVAVDIEEAMRITEAGNIREPAKTEAVS